jgi:uncharacterized protein (TIGR03086 family)
LTIPVVDDRRSSHRTALELAGLQLAEVDATDLRHASPCQGWALADLLAHMVGQHRGFALAVREGRAPVEAYAPKPYSADVWQDSVTELLAAFAHADLDRPAVAIELSPDPMPVRRMLAAQLLDTVVHTWDVAAALDLAFTPSPQMVAPILAMAERIPDGDNRTVADAAFAPALPAPESDWGRLLALLGRRLSI